MANYSEIIAKLKSQRNERNIAGMARFGISVKGTLGISIPVLRKMAKKIGKNQELSLKLWDSGIHEARLLAGFIGQPELATEKQMLQWAKETDSWDICDQVCSNLFDRTPFAWKKTSEWCNRKEEFVKRYAYVLMATLSVHDKKASDGAFLRCLPLIKLAATDERNFVKKAVNWALRQIGKRNMKLNRAAIACAKSIAKIDSKSARWIASNALSELEDEKVRKRIKERTKN
jgi:3-methyladenine DNA glycosylase AlkD